MRFLCLHGQGTSSDVLKTQIASLRYHLDATDSHEFDFIDGAVLWPPARGIREVFGDEVESFSYFDESAASILGAVVDLAQYIDTHGPFDGVIGFSQGAVLAATLIIAQSQTQMPRRTESESVVTVTVPQTLNTRPTETQQTEQTHGSRPTPSPCPMGDVDPSTHLPRLPPFRCAVFLCGGLPFAWEALKRGRVELITPSLCDRPAPRIEIPVVNCWATHDEDYPGMGPPLSQLCAQEVNQQVIHRVGHAVPADGDDLMALVDAVKATLDRVR
ncbi:uncharacterized protein KD926_011694 [Aspergillus affinis]|uniref:uncharacterized protein n=1 Tax=Aspergillus affinis TaxID=1070780 RepID=UPI0022FE9338|nr:uncharacterized protein KD926_011694 [Aspergillus affinis]KAI9044724.1 hypothetical protein KD926_011694 [Aspergillus affinis]